MAVLRGPLVLTLLVMGSLWGCSTVTPAPKPSSLSSPFFIPTAEDATRVALLARELDAQGQQCSEVSACERMDFARGLASLFENQQAARASFRQVIEHNPESPLAASSQVWVRLIDSEEDASTKAGSWALTQIAAQYAREWIERQVTEWTDLRKAAAPIVRQVAADQQVEQVRNTYTMSKQLRERERQIANLRAQLEALKLIEQDHENHRKMRPPASLKAADQFSHSP